MKSNTVDVYFYVSLDQKTELLDDLANRLTQLPGVKKANINPRMPRLLDVVYDADQLTGNDLAHYVKESGYPAAMVGM